MGPFAVRLSETAAIWRRAVAPVAEWVAKQFWSTTQKRTLSSLAPTHLTQAHRREAKGMFSEIVAQGVRRTENLCPSCGKTIRDRSASCARCGVSQATERLAIASRLGRAAAQTPEALAKQAASQRRHSRARSAWDESSQPAWLTPELFSREHSAVARNRYDICHSINHRRIPLVREPNSPRLPTACEALAGAREARSAGRARSVWGTDAGLLMQLTSAARSHLVTA